jgi:molybdopterin converting factor small subunit
MPQVFIPPLMRPLTGGRDVVVIDGQNVRELIEHLDLQYPGIRNRLIEGDQLRSGLAVAIGTKVSSRGLMSKTQPNDEVHFLPAIGGG